MVKAELEDHNRPTLMVVTHDIEEALVLSDWIVVLHGQPGQVQEIVTPNLPARAAARRRPFIITKTTYSNFSALTTRQSLRSELSISYLSIHY